MTLNFTCGERKTCSTIKKSQNITNVIVLKSFLFLFLSLLTFINDKNSQCLAGIYYIFVTERPKQNLKGFQNQIRNSAKRS